MTTARLLCRLLREAARRPGRLALAAGALLLGSLGRVGTTLLLVLWAEGPLARRDTDGILSLAALSLAAVAGVALAVGVARAALAALDQVLVEDLRNRAVESLLQGTLGAARRVRAGDVVTRVLSDAGAVAGVPQVLLRDLLGDGVLAVAAIGLAVTLSPPLALALAGVAALAGGSTALFGGPTRRRAAAARASRGELAALVEERLRGLAAVKAALAEGREARRLGEASRRLSTLLVAAERLGALHSAVVFAVTGAGALFVLFVGSREAAAGRLSIGTLVAVFVLAGQVVEPVRRVGEAWASLQHALPAAERLYALLDLPAEGGGGSAEEVASGALRLEGVSFAYDGGPPVLDGLTLEVRDGEAVAVVAASGGGKSTLAALLWRLAEPTRGRLLLGGHDLAALSLASVRRAVCVVEQDPFLFAGTLGANVAYGSPGATAEEVAQAVRLVGLDDLVASLPRGLAEPVGERGATLSGGQRQRVALARAFLRSPRLLVLDEATQALDAEAEEALLARLGPFLAGRTTLVMAHRLSTVARLPRVVVLEGGRVVADGAPRDLLGTDPVMRALFCEGPRPLSAPRATVA